MTRTKKCTKCERELPLSAFTLNSQHKDGRRSRCGECLRANYARNRDKVLRQQRESRVARRRDRVLDRKEVARRAYNAARGEGGPEVLLRELLKRGLDPDAAPAAAVLIVALDSAARDPEQLAA